MISSAEASLFFSALISSTILPGGSEAFLAYLVASGDAQPLRLVLIATVGNTLGALTTWALGYWISRYRSPAAVLEKVSASTIERLRRWGVPLLLLSWLPVVGDGFCLAAGWLRFPFVASMLAIFTGKLLRYWVVVQAAAALGAT